MFGFSSVSTSGVASTSSLKRPHAAKRGSGDAGAEALVCGVSQEMENRTPPTIPAKRSTSLIYAWEGAEAPTFSGMSKMADFL